MTAHAPASDIAVDRAAYPGREILDGFLDRIAGLGIEARLADDQVPGHSLAELSLDGRRLCRVEFSSFGDRFTLNVMPLDRADKTLLVNVSGRVCEPEPAYRAEQLDHAEALLRAALVREGAMSERDFPTDYALRRWVASASALKLPQERSQRRHRTEGVVFRPGDLPRDDLRVSTPVSKAIVQASRLLDVDFERGRAIDVAWAAAATSVDRDGDGRPLDRAHAYLVQSARTVVRGRRRDMDLAWDRSGLDRVLALHGDERDDMRVPLSLSEASHAPRLW